MRRATQAVVPDTGDAELDEARAIRNSIAFLFWPNTKLHLVPLKLGTRCRCVWSENGVTWIEIDKRLARPDKYGALVAAILHELLHVAADDRTGHHGAFASEARKISRLLGLKDMPPEVWPGALGAAQVAMLVAEIRPLDKLLKLA